MLWSPEDVALANTITAEEWVDVHDNYTAWPTADQRDRYSHWLFWNLWDVVIWAQRLTWQYGPEGALDRLNEGRRLAA